MKPLKKAEARRFAKVCEIIREALHLDHWENEYRMEPQSKDYPNRLASSLCLVEGRRLQIALYPAFWKLGLEKQLTTLIHEHVHAVHQTQDQVVHKIIDWSHDADRRWSEMIYVKANEHVTDHLTSVLYDLLEDRLLDVA